MMGGNMMSTLFGGNVSDNWLQSRGEAIGTDIMSMLIAEIYDDDELELPATTRRTLLLMILQSLWWSWFEQKRCW